MTERIYQITYPVDSLPALEALARHLASRLRPGDVVALDGPLGAGKTTFVQKLGEALHLADRPVSPTFVLVHEYTGGPYPVVHADLYRLGEGQAESLADDLFSVIEEGRSLVLVEWAMYGRFLEDVITVSMRFDMEPGADTRHITIESTRLDLVEGLVHA